ncbi:hypothetical protein [Micromonospora chokoriensis]
MSFSNPIVVELYAGSLGFIDITSDVRQGTAHSGGGITIDRGMKPYTQQTSPGRCTLTLNNREGKYSPRNPLSPLYGLIGRNTPIRFSMPLWRDSFNRTVSGGIGTSDTGQTWTTASPADWNVSAGKAVLTFPSANLLRTAVFSGDTTVDADQVIDIAPSANMTGATMVTGFVARYTNSSNFYWLRAEFDVGNTMTLKIGRVLNGVETELGIKRPVPGVTYGPNTPIRVRACVAGSEMSMKAWPAGSPEPAEWHLTVGDASLRQAGNVGLRSWLLSTNTNTPSPSISFSNYTITTPRFQGEISAWPQHWLPDNSDQWVLVEAAGILRRLNQGQKALNSPIYRNMIKFGPTAYLPLEDGFDSTVPTNAAVSGYPVSGVDITYAADDTLLGAVTSARLGSATSAITMQNKPTSGNSAWSVVFYFKLDSLPASEMTFLRVKSNGTVTDWVFSISGTEYRWIGTDGGGVQKFNRNAVFGTGLAPTGWIAMQLIVKQAGSDVDAEVKWHGVGGTSFITLSAGTTDYAGTAGNATSVLVGPSSLPPACLGHLALYPSDFFFSYDFMVSSAGYVGDTAGNRIRRLAEEEGVPVAVAGDRSDTELMGRQKADTFLNLLKSCADADGGILYETVAGLGLIYRTRASLYNQTPLDISYGDGQVSAPFLPVEDDGAIRNDVTVKRDGGSSARSTLDSGPLSVQPAPNGVGIYDETVTLSLATDQQAPHQAGWRVHLGTVDEARYPRLRVNLASPEWTTNPLLTRKAAALDSGDLVAVTDLPANLPPGPISLMVQGYTERHDGNEWDITWNATPGTPWTVAQASGEMRVDSDSSVVAAAVNSSATSLLVHSERADLWTTDATDFPIPILVGGEEMLVTSVSPARVFGDTFQRVGGWASPDVGPAWLLAGSLADYHVNGSRGVFDLTSIGARRTASASVNLVNFDLMIDWIKTPAVPTGNNVEINVFMRYVDASNYVAARLFVQPNNTITADIQSKSNGAEWWAGSFPVVPGATATTALSLRLQGSGTTVRMKVWPSGQPEPIEWFQTFTVNHVAPGDLSLSAYRYTGNTNSTPYFVEFDNVGLVSPQEFTVVRSINGIVKAQPAGTNVRVAYPAIVPL